MIVVWDEAKRLANIGKLGLDFAGLDEAFFASSVIGPARGNRLKAVGGFDGHLIVVIFALLGSEGISIISMRRAGWRERKEIDDIET